MSQQVDEKRRFRVVAAVEVIRDESGNVSRDRDGRARVVNLLTGEEVKEREVVPWWKR